MISTRGVKFKFAEGEKVLCYEPDPTKAKVLYESKVLDLCASRDGRGRKVCEYLIHFFGWNSSWDRYVREEFILPYTEENRELQAKLAEEVLWDRYVREEFILPYTEENRELQAKLAEEAAMSLKGKKKHKLPPLIKETLSKKMCAKNENQEQIAKQPKTPSHSSSDTESSEDEVEKEIIIEIPGTLKTILEEDCMLITQKNKFVKLPCENNVISILENYVKHYASVLLCTSPPRNVKNGQKLMPEDVKNKLNLCKEAMDGLRVFFDFTLPHLLLYRQEKTQYYTVGTTCTPIYNLNSFKCEPLLEDESIELRCEESTLRKFDDPPQNLDDNSLDSDFKIKEVESVLQESFHKSSPRKLNLRNQSQKSVPGNIETVVHGDTNTKNVEMKHQNQSPKEKSHKKIKSTQSKSTSTRILRSSDKQKQQGSSNELLLNISSESLENNSATQNAKISDSSSEPTSPLRVTRKSGQNPLSPSIHLQRSPSSVSYDKSVPNSPTSSIPNIENSLPQSISSNYFSSSNSSTHSTLSSTLLETQQYHRIHNSTLLQEIMSWHMIPEYLYDQVPASPSLIYGAPHLLRLFVKLPALLSKMSIKQKKLEVLLKILEKFLLYLADKNEELFSPTLYVDAFLVGSLGMLF